MITKLARTLTRGMLRVFVVGIVAGTVLGVVFVVGMRTKSPAVQRLVRKANKASWNPKAMQTAGTPGAYASIVRHTGRTSGTTYDTPIVAVRTEDGFVVALPYGPDADWVRNVLAAERATITHEGETFDTDRPEVLPIDQADVYFGESERRAHQLFKVDQCLRLRIVDTTSADTASPAGATDGDQRG